MFGIFGSFYEHGTYLLLKVIFQTLGQEGNGFATPPLVSSRNDAEKRAIMHTYQDLGLVSDWLKQISNVARQIGQLHDDVILLQLPESFSLLFFYAN